MPDDQITSHEERIRLLREKADREGVRIDDDVLAYIATKYGLPQTLKGALVQVIGLSSVRGVPIDMALARKALGDPAEIQPPLVAPPATSTGQAPPEPIVDADSVELAGDEWDAIDDVVDDAWDAVDVPADDPGPEPSAAAPHEPAQTTFDLPGFGEAPPEPERSKATVYFAPIRTKGKKSLVSRSGQLLDRAGLAEAIADDDLVAVKLHFGERGNTGFVQPIFLREVVARVKEAGGKPFLTDANTLYRGQRFNAVEHLACAIHNGFSYATVEAPIMIADGLDGRDAVDVPISGTHFDSVRIGTVAAHADAMVVVTHVKGHEATGFGGALKNVGMGLGCRSAKQRMHADFSPEPDAEKCIACGRCVTWCPVDAMTIGPDRVAVVDYEVCYGCGECVAACPHGAISIDWKTEPAAIQEKIAEHVAGAVSGKEGKVVYLSFVTDISPDCDCWHFSDASVVPDIGVLASTDPVAIDQAAYDLVVAAPGLPGTRGEGLGEGVDTFAEVTGIDGTQAMRHAEELGLGSRAYDLITVD